MRWEWWISLCFAPTIPPALQHTLSSPSSSSALAFALSFLDKVWWRSVVYVDMREIKLKVLFICLGLKSWWKRYSWSLRCIVHPFLFLFEINFRIFETSKTHYYYNVILQDPLVFKVVFELYDVQILQTQCKRDSNSYTFALTWMKRQYLENIIYALLIFIILV